MWSPRLRAVPGPLAEPSRRRGGPVGTLAYAKAHARRPSCWPGPRRSGAIANGSIQPLRRDVVGDRREDLREAVWRRTRWECLLYQAHAWCNDRTSLAVLL